jgi:hypothetical protein
VSRRADRRLLEVLITLQLQVARRETKVDILQSNQQPAPPAPSSALPTIGGIVGFAAGAVTTWSQLTGKA